MTLDFRKKQCAPILWDRESMNEDVPIVFFLFCFLDVDVPTVMCPLNGLDFMGLGALNLVPRPNKILKFERPIRIA